ncbi:MFS transporter [Psychrobacter phenylpyruvicus]|uniref:Muropeptide transporter n=1 Tax=Psychrobacter phenylpyruvicus TaxID=29432 RepID=A0A379LLG6_9GAMM|nr:MFS transporter [Psychrobacter phenylpyruvicus]SUD91430.1 muropeptide transporter [Psychrobacter phenylpyruvicus]
MQKPSSSVASDQDKPSADKFDNNVATNTNQSPYALMLVLLTLYFAQGLPSGFITQALPAILREYEVSLEMIGLSGLLLLPWALKFLWAPVVDKYFITKWGRSRSWILPLQLISAIIVALVGLFDPHQLSSPHTLWAIYALLFLLSLIGATHDVAADGLATRSLTGLIRNNPPLPAVKNPYQGMGNAAQVIGYRMGLILGGGVLLLVLGQWSWRYSFFAMAALIVLNTIPIWRYPESKYAAAESKLTAQPVTHQVSGEHQTHPSNRKLTLASLFAYIKSQYGYFWQNEHMRAWLAVLLTFKVVDGISSGMVKPMMVDMGIPTSSIGLWASVLGSAASLVGAALAAVLLKRMTHHNALLAFNALQVATTALYVIVAISFEHPSWLGFALEDQSVPFWWAYAANAIEHLAGAMALVAMLTMVMHYARHDKAGSDFTTQVCLLTVFSGGAHLISGFIAAQVGYSVHFIISVALGCVCLLPLIYWRGKFVKQL